MLFVLLSENPPGPDAHTIRNLLTALASTRSMVSYAEIIDILGIHGVEVTADDVSEVARQHGFLVLDDDIIEETEGAQEELEVARGIIKLLRGTRRQRRKDNQTPRTGNSAPESGLTIDGMPF